MILRRLQAEGFKHLQGIDLVFPPKGTFLIQGSNEAGKSSLFEVVFFALFARPLQARSSEDLIGYGLNEAKIYLELELAKNDLRIERIIRRNKANAVRLVIGEEMITTAREANRRIQEELHLDADTLLNSSFVEQKALEKLEGLDRAARENAVMKLLNLERMQALEEELRVKREDERYLDEWGKKKRVAEIREEIPALRKEIEHYERLREFQEAEGLLKEAENQRKLAAEEEKKLPSLEERRNVLQSKVQELHKLQDKEHKVDNLLASIRVLTEKEIDLDRLNKELEAVGKARENLPQLQRRREKAQTLIHLLHDKLARLEKWLKEAEEWEALKKEINKGEREAESLNLSLEAKTKEIENTRGNIELLKQWRDMKEKEEKVRLRENLYEEKGRSTTQGFVSLGVAIVLFSLLFFSPFKWLSTIAVLPLICAVFSFKRRGNALLKIAKLEGEVGSIDLKDLKTLQASLVKRGIREFQNSKEIEEALKREEEKLQFLEKEGTKLRDDIVRIRERMDMLEKRSASEFSLGSPTPSPEVIAKRREKISYLLNKWRNELEEVASQFALPTEEEALKDVKRSLDNEIKNAQELILKEGELLKGKEADELEIQNLKKEIERGAAVLLEEIGDIFSREEWEKLKMGLKKARDQLEKEEVERKLQEAIGHLKAQEQKVASYRERAEELERKAKEKLSELGTPPEHLPSLEEINNALDDKRAELRRIEKELEALQEQIIGDIPPLEQCRAEYEKLEKELKIRNLSATILGMARQNITKKILPRTIEHMWSILPLITNDRYRQVTLDEESFKIRVYDERAGDWKDKQIFSGGTRDQMSLALRLAFALAALPQERGTAPRFLFLDEPLSSFDEQRKEALVKVITEGEIAEAFDQIFVISHTPLLNPNLFHYYIVMENGRIKECSEELIPPEKRGFPLL